MFDQIEEKLDLVKFQWTHWRINMSFNKSDFDSRNYKFVFIELALLSVIAYLYSKNRDCADELAKHINEMKWKNIDWII